MAAVRRAASRATPGRDLVRFGPGVAADDAGGHRDDRNQAALVATLHKAVDERMEQLRARAEALIRLYMPPVPLQLLRSSDTPREMLQHLCRERGIAFGCDDSGASLKASLVRSNAYSRTSWGARMMWMAQYLRGEAQQNRGYLKAFEMAIRHPPGVGMDQPLVPAAKIRYTPVATLSERPVATPPLPSPASSLSPGRPPLYGPSPTAMHATQDDPPAPPSTVDVMPLRRAIGCSPAPPAQSEQAPSPLNHQEPSDDPVHSAPAANPLPTDLASVELLPSSHHAALMMQSSAVEQAARADINVSHFDKFRGLVINIATADNASAQSAAASANRQDGAIAKVVFGKIHVFAAVAAIKSAVPHWYGSAHRPSKRTKKLASSCGQARAGERG